MKRTSRDEHLITVVSRAVMFIGFASSGFASMIYEVVWQRTLTNTIGDTVYSTTVTIAAFMCGMAIGSYFVAENLRKGGQFLAVFALLQFGVGLFGLATFFLIDWLDEIFKVAFVYLPFSEARFVWFQLPVSFFVVLVPALFMGGSFPAIIRAWSGGFEKLSADAGSLYAINTWGAAMGALFAGFVLVPIVGLLRADIIAVMINFAVAAAAYSLVGRLPEKTLSTEVVVGMSGVE